MSTDTHWHTTVDSPIGPLGLVATDAGLRAVSWRGDETSVKLPDDMVEDPDRPILRLAAHQLGEYFDGDRTSFDLPLDLRGTPFQEAAWRALGDIPYG
ncbi:MAG: cysteine methyltransferase, partial [Acidimicrobiales bacterium]|nr:cysteine methyltransferase [Acidimicrobiales bacterium]